jgi:hypothetical protein
MTPFQQIFPITGLSRDEACVYLDVSPQRLGKWIAGDDAPDGVITELEQLRQAIELVAEGHEIQLPHSGAKKEAWREFLRLQRAKHRANG